MTRECTQFARYYCQAYPTKLPIYRPCAVDVTSHAHLNQFTIECQSYLIVYSLECNWRDLVLVVIVNGYWKVLLSAVLGVGCNCTIFHPILTEEIAGLQQ